MFSDELTRVTYRWLSKGGCGDWAAGHLGFAPPAIRGAVGLRKGFNLALALAVGVLIIVVGGVAAQWVAWRFRLPAIVLLLAVGLLAGPVFGVIDPGHAMAGTLGPMVGLAVCIVVFEGGLALDFSELRAAGEGVLRLTVVALPISFVLGAIAARACTGMSWGAATLYGAITVVTGPTVILPLLRHTRLDRRTASLMKWEAIVNDPVGALLAAVVLNITTTKKVGFESVGVSVVTGAALAVALGVGAALLVRFLFTRDLMPEPLKTPVLLALAMGVYVLGNLGLSEAGLIASTIFGVLLANLRVPGISELRRFKEALVVLIVSALFITLAADLDRHVLTQLSWSLIGLTTVMLILVRPAAIALATFRSSLTWPERAITGWIAPRGIVAAAIAGVAGLRLQSAGIPGANLVMPAVFALITASVILHGFSLGPLARLLKLRLGLTPGLAIVGASDWSTDLATCLHQAGVGVLLVDTYPGALKPARELNLPILQAELLSEHGEEALESLAIDWILAATPNDIYNGLVCARLSSELGRERVFQTGPIGGLDPHRWVSRDWRGKVLGTPPWEEASLSKRYAEGWRFTAVVLEEPVIPVDRTPLIHVRNGAITLISVEDEVVPKVEAGDIAIVFGEVPAHPDDGTSTPAELAK